VGTGQAPAVRRRQQEGYPPTPHHTRSTDILRTDIVGNGVSREGLAGCDGAVPGADANRIFRLTPRPALARI
jgi:hypothetical protein